MMKEIVSFNKCCSNMHTLCHCCKFKVCSLQKCSWNAKARRYFKILTILTAMLLQICVYRPKKHGIEATLLAPLIAISSVLNIRTIFTRILYQKQAFTKTTQKPQCYRFFSFIFISYKFSQC
uniref:Uncharacterized protein n=1 Tax=Nothoprocta perdicaria TaxID=30464 RepID=A0A8C6Z8W3_NOTPE